MLIVRGVTQNPETQIGYLGSLDQVLLQQGYAGFESLRPPALPEPIRLLTGNTGLLSQRSCKAGLACSLCSKSLGADICEDASIQPRKVQEADIQE